MESLYHMFELNYIFRILVAGLCGAAIGYERKSRLKEAGVRTHFIVACASALMMVVSKYGFMDVVVKEGIGLDPSRVAAQIVSGIGFLGAGIIFVQKRTITGLTTAAGIWGTAGIGMAVGCGMYPVGIAATLVILLVQMLLHRNFPLVPLPKVRQMNIVSSDEENMQEKLNGIFKKNRITLLHIKMNKDAKERTIKYECILEFPKNFTEEQLMAEFDCDVTIKSVPLGHVSSRETA